MNDDPSPVAPVGARRSIASRLRAPRWLRRIPPKVLLVALVLLVGLALYRPVGKVFLTWRAGRLVAQSAEFAAEERWEEARRTALASMQIRNSLEALRLLFRANRATGDSTTLYSGVALFRHEDATAEDRLEVITAALDVRDLIAAAELLGSLGETAEADPQLAYQRVRLHLAMGERDAAMALADRHAGEPDRARFVFLLAEELSWARSPELQAAVVSRLGRVLDLPVPAREAALQAMVSLASLPPEWDLGPLPARVVERFGSETNLTPEQDLALAAHRIASDPSRREGIVDSLVARYRNDVARLVPWLARIDEWERVVEITDGAKLDNTTFNHRITALHRLKRFDVLSELLSNPPVAIPGPLLLAARASILADQGDAANGILVWRQAMQLAEQDRSQNLFYRLAGIARRTGERDREMEALAKAVLHRRGAPPPAAHLEPLFAWLHLNDQPGELLTVTYRLLEREPRNPILQNNYQYLRLLAGEPAPDAEAALRGLVAAFPANPGYRGSLALALVQAGKPAEAALAIEEPALPLPAFGPSGMAIYAAALAALRRDDDLARVLPAINWDAIPESEGKVLRDLIKRAKAEREGEGEDARRASPPIDFALHRGGPRPSALCGGPAGGLRAGPLSDRDGTLPETPA